MTAKALWYVLIALQLLLVSLLATRFERELDAERADVDDTPAPHPQSTVPPPAPRQLLVGALESIQATTPGFTPPTRTRTADALGWLALAIVIVTTLAAVGGHWS